MADLPSNARVVIVGGGIVGVSVAYHLAQRGVADVVLLERKQLTCGTTWHAAGLVGQLRATHNLTRLAQYTTNLFATLEAETGQATGFQQRGSVAVATNVERFEELTRGASMARCFGLPVDIITPGDVKEMLPLANVDDVVGAVHLPGDGVTNPIDTTMALAKGARAKGVRIIENVLVDRIVVTDGRAVGVEYSHEGQTGQIRADAVVNAAGMWGRDLGDAAGVTVPLHAAEHFYIVTEGVEGISPTMPVLRDQDGCGYFKEDAGKLLVGWFEPVAKPWGMRGIPAEFCFDSLPEDYEHIAPLVEAATSACRCWPRPASACSSTDPRRSHPTTATSSARRPRWLVCTSRAGSTRSASRVPEARAKCSPTGSSTVTRRWTCGTSTLAV